MNQELGFAAVMIDPSVGMEAAVRSLGERPEVTNSIPVMIDENGSSRYFLPDQVTVQFKPAIDKERAEAIIVELGSSVVAAQRTPGYYTVSLPENQDIFEAIRTFSQLNDVAFCEPSEVGFNSALPYIPNDPGFGNLWGLHNTGQTVNGTLGLADVDIDAPEAWDISRGDPEVIVAVIDTGADLGHNDLRANIFPRGTEDWDFADTGDPNPQDEATNSHGTHVCGTVAATDDNIGVIGVAPRCRLMPLRVNLVAGMNQNRADAINYVRMQAAAHSHRRYVVNCSWRMNGDHAGVRTAIQSAVRNNVVIVYAAGNDNANTDNSPGFPGVYPEVISVAALDQRGRRANFSNFGTNVDVAAPGVNIWSTTRNGAHGFLAGTSMAAPHVAGVAALIWSCNRNFSNHQVRAILEGTCDNIDAVNPGFIGMLGRGRINAHRAVRLAASLETQPLLTGTFTLEQLSSGRFVDAHEHAGEDFRVVTRPEQDNDTQRWVLTYLGDLYTLQWRVNGRFVDAHEHAGEDFRVVTRPPQHNDTQRWVATRVDTDTYTLQQLSSGRFVDAHEHAGEDFRVVTRPPQDNDTQRWVTTRVGTDTYTLQQRSSSRFMDAHGNEEQDFRVVTRPEQGNNTQRWVLTVVGRVYTLQQRSSSRFMDAHEHAGEDFRVVTRPPQDNDTQRWVAINVGPDTYTLQQLSSGRFVDAHEHAGEDFRVVTRPRQDNDTQRWVIRPT